MDKAVCSECAEDSFLKKIIEQDGEPLECSVCGNQEANAITVQQLGELIEPIMREHFSPGPEVKRFGDNDRDWWEQEGDPMSEAVQEVLGQYFEFEDEIVDAVVEADDYMPQDGGEAYWDKTSHYVPSRVRLEHYFAEWDYTLTELKHSRRFFSPSAQSLFAKLFEGIEDLKASGRPRQPVVRVLPAKTRVFRARVCDLARMLPDIVADPFKHVGPPPNSGARAGRMNSDGVVAFYGAFEEDTCLAEMRPALHNELALISVETTRPLRVLDFLRLEEARTGKALSYFQPDFTEQVERRAFLRHLHRLISQPVVPGHESDYLITQTMAEYLAHVHKEPFDGILFSSAQRAKGTNVVLFSNSAVGSGSVAEGFRIEYVDKSIKLFTTTGISYKHRQVEFYVSDDGRPWLHHEPEDEFDEWP